MTAANGAGSARLIVFDAATRRKWSDPLMTALRATGVVQSAGAEHPWRTFLNTAATTAVIVADKPSLTGLAYAEAAAVATALARPGRIALAVVTPQGLGVPAPLDPSVVRTHSLARGAGQAEIDATVAALLAEPGVSASAGRLAVVTSPPGCVPAWTARLPADHQWLEDPDFRVAVTDLAEPGWHLAVIAGPGLFEEPADVGSLVRRLAPNLHVVQAFSNFECGVVLSDEIVVISRHTERVLQPPRRVVDRANDLANATGGDTSAAGRAQVGPVLVMGTGAMMTPHDARSAMAHVSAYDAEVDAILESSIMAVGTESASEALVDAVAELVRLVSVEPEDRFEPGIAGYSDTRPKSDLLGRESIRKVLAESLTHVPQSERADDGPRVISLEGPWGTGKTAMLSDLADDVAKKAAETGDGTRHVPRGWIRLRVWAAGCVLR